MLGKKLKKETRPHSKVSLKNNADIYNTFEKTQDNLKGEELVDYLLDNVFVINDKNLSYKDKQGFIQKEVGQPNHIPIKDRDTQVYLNARDSFVYKKFDYERINHFKDKLNSIQAKENKIIPEEVLEEIDLELKKMRKTFKDLDYRLTRKILKIIGKTKYYRNIYLIISITKKEYIEFPSDIEEEMYRMFEKIQIPFEKYKGSCRTSFLSYEYTLYKFLQILGLDEYLDYCRLLDSDDKLYDHDKIWGQICRDVGFEFIPTVRSNSKVSDLITEGPSDP